MFQDFALEVMVDAAVTCGRVAQRECHLGLDVKAKPDDTPGVDFTTQADTEGQAAGIKVFERRLPNRVVIAEEMENRTVVPADCVVFDPLDGTINADDGRDEWAARFVIYKADNHSVE
jgi:fructose-1,6-bisphosphatase/inositol monophosphatase family enzyme